MPDAITVDGRRYTAHDIRQLEDMNRRQAHRIAFGASGASPLTALREAGLIEERDPMTAEDTRRWLHSAQAAQRCGHPAPRRPQRFRWTEDGERWLRERGLNVGACDPSFIPKWQRDLMEREGVSR